MVPDDYDTPEDSTRGERRGRQRHSDWRGSQSRRSALDSLLEGSSTYMNALIGGIAGIVLSFIPLSTVLGGILAGYLEAGPDGYGTTTRGGLTVGGLAGLVTFLPFLLIAWFAFSVVAVSGGPAFGGILLIFFLFIALYTIGISMIGGVIGVYIRQEIESRPPERRGW